LINDEDARIDLAAFKSRVGEANSQGSIIDLKGHILPINRHLDDIAILDPRIVLELNPLIILRLESLSILESEPPFILRIQLFKSNPAVES